MIGLERRRAMMAQNSVETYDFTPLLFAPIVDGYDEEGVEQFNTDAYDLSAAEVNIIEKFNASKLKNKAAIFSILSTATSINVRHTGATIRLFQTIGGVESYTDHTDSNTDIPLASGSTHRYAIIYDTDSNVSIRDNQIIAAAGVVRYTLYRSSGNYIAKQLYYSNGAISPILAYWSSANGNVYRIPEGMTSLEVYATQQTKPSQIVVPSNFISFGTASFQGAPLNIGTLVIPESVTSIRGDSFSYQIKKLYLKSPARFVWQFLNGNTIVDKEIRIADSADADKNGLNRGYKLENDGTYFYYIDKGTNEKLLLKAHANSTIIKQEAGVTFNTGAFAGCENAVPQGDIVLPNSNASMFYKCRKLTSITIPDSVTSIGNYALGSTGLTSITIPNSVTSIGVSAFNGCSSLSNIEFQGTSLKTIGNAAFNNSNLEEIIIPSGVETINISLCMDSKNLKRAIVLGNITTVNGWNGAGAFEKCTALEYFSIKGNFTNLNSLLFKCTALTTLIFDVATPPAAGASDYFGNSSNRKATTVYVPDESISLYEAHDFWKNYTIKPISEAPEL